MSSYGRRPPGRLASGDLQRVLRECLSRVRGRVVMVAVTQGAEFDNETAAVRWRALNSRIRAELTRAGSRPPRVVARVTHRQQRGADHLHLVFLARTLDEMARVRSWVELYREHKDAHGFGWVDDPFRLRRVGGRRRDMVFAEAGRAAGYLAPYMNSEQLQRAWDGEDRSWRMFWVSPALQRMCGWSMGRCRWVRQGWRIAQGTWTAKTWYGAVSWPTWWERPDHRAWVLAVLGLPPGWEPPPQAAGRAAAIVGAAAGR